MSSDPSEKIHRVQFPSGRSFFRPDLNFDGASEREVEVREPPNTIEDIFCYSNTLSIYKVVKSSKLNKEGHTLSPSFSLFVHVCVCVYTALPADKKLLG